MTTEDLAHLVSFVEQTGMHVGAIWRNELATREAGSEWEPIKFFLKGDGYSNKTNTLAKSRLRLNYPSWPRPT
jgi:hypothetical protein